MTKTCKEWQKKSSKFVYILAKQSRSPFNLTDFFSPKQFQNSNFATLRFSNPKLVGTLHFDGFLTYKIQLSNTSIFYSTSRPLSFVCSVLSLLNNSSRPHHHKVVATFLSQSHYWLCPTTRQTHYSISLNFVQIFNFRKKNLV